MAKVPMIPGRSHISGIPDISVVPRVTPEDFGGREYNEVFKLGRAVQGAGNAQMDWSIRKYEEEADTEANAAYATMLKDVGQEQARISQLQGEAAQNARKDLEDFTRNRGESLGETLKKPRSKELLAKKQMNLDVQNAQWADQFSAREQEKSRQTNLLAVNDGLLNNSILHGTDIGIVSNNIEQAKQNIAGLYVGMPQAFIEQEQRKYVMSTATQVAQGIATREGPGAALAFLNSGIENEIADNNGPLQVQFAGLRNQYGQAAKSDMASRAAMADIGLSSADMLKRSLELFPNDPENQKLYLATGDDYRKRLADDSNRVAVEGKKAVWSEFAKSGWQNIPQNIRSTDHEMFKEMVSYQQWIKKAQSEGYTPDLSYRNTLLSMQPSQLREWMADTNNEQEMLRKMAGSETHINKIYDYALKDDDDPEAARNTGKSGKNVFKADDFFTDAYGATYPGWTGNSVYDSTDATGKSRLNGFLLRYEDAVESLKNDPDRKGKPVSYEEQKDIAFGLIKQVRLGQINLDVSMYDQSKEPKNTPVVISVPKVEMTSEQMAMYQGGEVYDAINPETKNPERFERIPPSVMHVNIRNANPKSVDRAYQAGVKHGMTYDAGDNIIIYKDGRIEIRGPGPEWKYKTGANPKMVQGEAPQAQEAPVRPPRPDRAEELKIEFGNEYSEEWAGENLIVTVPGAVYVFDSLGDLIQSTPNM